MKFPWTSSQTQSTASTSYNITELLSIRSFYSFIWTQSTEALEHIAYAVLVYGLVCLAIYKLISLSANSRLIRPIRFLSNVRLPPLEKIKRVLFVISHPDDECMFFGPLILTMTKRLGCDVHILCLSNGNYEKQGNIRRRELWDSCKMLGVPSSNITLIKATHLPDDPNVDWKVESIANIVQHEVESLRIQTVITFDRDGISQHPNHCAVYYAISSLCLANLLPKDCKIYILDSINTVRKYISVFDLLFTFLMSTHWCVLSWEDASIVRRAMQLHKSQMKWFRWLYIYFSRYMFMNSLREINLSDVELEMQIADS